MALLLAAALASPTVAAAAPRPAPPTGTTAADALTPLPATDPLAWSAPAAIDDHPIEGLACPSASLCVAVDSTGDVLSSTDPLGDRPWQTENVDGGNFLSGIACPSITECVAVDGSGDVVSTVDPAGPASAWSVARVDTSITEPSLAGAGPDLLHGISCPATYLCVAADAVGNIVASGVPIGGASAWNTVHVDDDLSAACPAGGLGCQSPLMGVACPELSLCAAVDLSGDVLQSATPTAPAPWPSSAGIPTRRMAQSMWGISCPTATFCAAVDGIAGHMITWDPSVAYAPVVHRLPLDAFGVWCSSARDCVAAGETAAGDSELVGSTDPSSTAAAWAVSDRGDISTVSCPTSTLCVAGDDEGQVSLGVTVASLSSTLRREALGRVPPIGSLRRRRGDALRVTGALPGRLRILWQVDGAPTTTVATGSATFTGSRTHTVHLRLTAAGRRRLARTRRLRVAAEASYETNTGTVTVQRTLTLH